MSYIQLNKQLVQAAEKHTSEIEKGRMLYYRRQHKKMQSRVGAVTYMDSPQRYILMIGGIAEGEEVHMLGNEAKAQNEAFASLFRDEIKAAIDAGKPFGTTGCKSRKWRWLGPVGKEPETPDEE
jgi:hypothetical protein